MTYLPLIPTVPSCRLSLVLLDRLLTPERSLQSPPLIRHRLVHLFEILRVIWMIEQYSVLKEILRF